MSTLQRKAWSNTSLSRTCPTRPQTILDLLWLSLRRTPDDGNLHLCCWRQCSALILLREARFAIVDFVSNTTWPWQHRPLRNHQRRPGRRHAQLTVQALQWNALTYTATALREMCS